jgi:hypothetical protein
MTIAIFARRQFSLAAAVVNSESYTYIRMNRPFMSHKKVSTTAKISMKYVMGKDIHMERLLTDGCSVPFAAILVDFLFLSQSNIF